MTALISGSTSASGAVKRRSTSLIGAGFEVADITISWRRDEPGPNYGQGPELAGNNISAAQRQALA
jgi:hypothetical protein